MDDKHWHTLRWRGWLTVGLSLLLLLGGSNLQTDLCALRYQRGLAAEAAGERTGAITQYAILEAISPGYADVSSRLAELADEAHLHTLAQLAPEARIPTLHWLARSGRSEQLARLLDKEEAWIPAGLFPMGNWLGPEDQKPARDVYLDAFYLDRFEVTNAQYIRFLQESKAIPPAHWGEAGFPQGTAAHPVVGVSWEQAQAYCSWAGKRLPTEAEWEKACRSERGLRFPWGDAWVADKANTGIQHLESVPAKIEEAWTMLAQPAPGPGLGLQPVGSYPGGISPYGVHDLVGNASEWVADWYSWKGYGVQSNRNPFGDGPPWNRVVRGSSWFEMSGSSRSLQESSLCSFRSSSHSYDDPRVGFRCVRAPQ